MTRRVASLGVVVAAGAASLLASCRRTEPPTDPAQGLRDDPRLAGLLAGCGRSDPFDRKLADMVPILIEKLEVGGLEPQRRAKEELAFLGQAAIPALERMVERHFDDPQGFAYVLNALDVCLLTEAEGAHGILARCVSHPGDAIRIRAVQGLARGHGRPQDFDLLLAHLPLAMVELRPPLATALHACDPRRAEALYLDWLEVGENPDLWRFVVATFVGSRIPSTVARCGVLQANAPEDVRPFLAAVAAAGGDEGAVDVLRAELAHDDPQRRANAVAALEGAGLVGLLEPVLRDDPSDVLRVLAASALARAGSPDGRVRDLLRAGLDDPSPRVRDACLGILVGAGDPVGRERALDQLAEGPGVLGRAMSALRGPMEDDASLARAVLERLLERNALESFLALRSRTATLEAIGLVPLAQAARFLRALALAHGGETIEGLRAHEWLMIQGTNTGEPGRAYLMGELGGEADPLRRLDLLWAASASRSDATRERLLAFVEGDGAAPLEILFAADRLARLGPAAIVAPRLKRVAHRTVDAEARRALHCRLWHWY